MVASLSPVERQQYVAFPLSSIGQQQITFNDQVLGSSPRGGTMKTIIIHANENGVNTIKSKDVNQKEAYRMLLTSLCDLADKLTLDEIQEALNAQLYLLEL